MKKQLGAHMVLITALRYFSSAHSQRQVSLTVAREELIAVKRQAIGSIISSCLTQPYPVMAILLNKQTSRLLHALIRPVIKQVFKCQLQRLIE